MLAPRSQEQADLAHGTALLRAGSKSFALAGRLMPGKTLRDVTALYAFCRVADDLIDDAGDPHAAREAHKELSRRLDAMHVAATAGSDAAVEALTDPVDRALARTMRRQSLPRAPIDALLEGFLWDADGHSYATIEDTFAYAARVAGSVGVCMSWLMGRREPWVLARAADLGVAMQLTNIARDVGDDARMGRVYLPHTWLAEERVTPAELRLMARGPAHQPCPGVRATTLRLLDCADRLYGRGRAGIPALPGPCRPAIDAAARIYRAIGAQVRQAQPYTLQQRAVVPLWRKLVLLVCALALPWARRGSRADRFAAPLCANRFLLAGVGAVAAEGESNAQASQVANADACRPERQQKIG